MDVSGSMRSAYALDRSHHANVEVERIHAVFTTVLNIVKQEITHHKREESIFVSAFGLEDRRAVTCDLLSLLEFSDSAGSKLEVVIEEIRQRGASHAEPWIRKYLSEFEARLLYSVLKPGSPYAEQKIQKLIELIPSSLKMKAATMKNSTMGSWDALSR